MFLKTLTALERLTLSCDDSNSISYFPSAPVSSTSSPDSACTDAMEVGVFPKPPPSAGPTSWNFCKVDSFLTFYKGFCPSWEASKLIQRMGELTEVDEPAVSETKSEYSSSPTDTDTDEEIAELEDAISVVFPATAVMCCQRR